MANFRIAMVLKYGAEIGTSVRELGPYRRIMAPADENASTQIDCICYLVFLVAERASLIWPLSETRLQRPVFIPGLGLRIGGDCAMGHRRAR